MQISIVWWRVEGGLRYQAVVIITLLQTERETERERDRERDIKYKITNN